MGRSFRFVVDLKPLSANGEPCLKTCTTLILLIIGDLSAWFKTTVARKTKRGC
jgi:hypothetical protein